MAPFISAFFLAHKFKTPCAIVMFMSDTRTIMEVTEGTEEDRQYEAALNAVLHMDKRDYPAYVGGLKIASGHS